MTDQNIVEKSYSETLMDRVDQFVELQLQIAEAK
jgi:hypothetical protein